MSSSVNPYDAVVKFLKPAPDDEMKDFILKALIALTIRVVEAELFGTVKKSDMIFQFLRERSGVTGDGDITGRLAKFGFASFSGASDNTEAAIIYLSKVIDNIAEFARDNAMLKGDDSLFMQLVLLTFVSQRKDDLVKRFKGTFEGNGISKADDINTYIQKNLRGSILKGLGETGKSEANLDAEKKKTDSERKKGQQVYDASMRIATAISRDAKIIPSQKAKFLGMDMGLGSTSKSASVSKEFLWKWRTTGTTTFVATTELLKEVKEAKGK